MNTVIAVAKNLLNLVYPLHCALCRKPLDPADDKGICDFCLGAIERNPKPNCAVCGRPVPVASGPCPECRKMNFPFERASSICLYEGNAKELVHLFKYKNKLHLAGIISALMSEYIKENAAVIADIDAITYVPLHASRLKKRGFNQSKVLASKIATRFNIPLIDILEKTKSTRPQNELDRAKRLDNLKGSFRVRKALPLPRRLLLIDDVMTTGATLDECAITLLAAGAENVRCLTFARGSGNKVT